MTPSTDLITIAILAKDKAHVLPFYLDCIEKQTYPHNKIKLYIRSNNNNDHTIQILQSWIDKNKHLYSEVYFNVDNVEEKVENYAPHDWNKLKIQVLSRIRQDSIHWAKEKGTHYFTADCDNFIIPQTLELLFNTNVPVVAPLLVNGDNPDIPDPNFYHMTTQKGYKKHSPFDIPILNREIQGLIEVQLVHCTYFIQHHILEHICYNDLSNRHEYVIFSDSLWKMNIPQYIDNRYNYGKYTFCDTHEDFTSRNITI